jgi:N-ethylmaleimide reductase
LYQYLTAELNKLSPAYIHLVGSAARSKEEGVDLLKKVRQTFQGALILNGGYTPETASEVITAGMADLVSFGSPFIANPDLPYRIQQQVPLTAPDPSLFFSPGKKGYIDYSRAPTALQAE